MRRLQLAASLLLGGAAACTTAAPVRVDRGVTRNAGIAFFEARLAAEADDILAPGALADRYLARFGVSHEFADVWRADSVLTLGLAAHPRYAPFLARLAAVHIARHEFPEALAAARLAWEVAPRRSRNGRLFDAWFEVGRFDSAVAALNRMDPDGWGYLIRRARFEEVQGHYDAARWALRRACVSTTVDDPRLVAWCAVRQGDVELAAGRPGRAGRRYRTALDVQPGDRAALTGLGRLAASRGRFDEAKRWYLEAAGRGDLESLLALAQVLDAGGEAANARSLRLAFLHQARDPRYGRGYWSAIAVTRARLGDHAGALALAEADRAQRPGPESYATLARVHALASRHAAARAAADSALVWAPASPKLHALRDSIVRAPSLR